MPSGSGGCYLQDVIEVWCTCQMAEMVNERSKCMSHISDGAPGTNMYICLPR
jgi:hypothetical protein